MKKSARQIAFDVLLRVERDAAYSNLAVSGAVDSADLSSADSAFATALVYGVLERLITLDYNLALYLKQPLKRMKPEVLTALRMGAYQLLFMDKVPQSAAVNESVALVRNNRSAFAAGVTNAVLRRVSENGISLPGESDEVKYLSVKYSCPEWLIELWESSYGAENAQGVLAASVGRAPIYIRVNSEKTSPDELIARLADEGVEAERSEILPQALEITLHGSVERLEAYREGLFHVQDLSSQLCCEALAAQPGESVLDVCAAPGGKTFTIAQHMRCKGRLLSCDIYPARLELIRSGAERLGLGGFVNTAEADASVFNPELGEFDRILCDVPCSGLGVIRRKPEIRYKQPCEVDKLPDLQYHILSNVSRYLRRGGRLIYSTCSLNPRENTDVCERFLSEHSNFELCTALETVKSAHGNGKYLTLMPHIHSTDGFFIAALCRTE